MSKQNVLRQIKTILYRLKRNYGVKAGIYKALTNTNDVTTGEISRTYAVTRLARVIVLLGSAAREFVYDLSFIAANKNFTYGGFFDEQSAIFIIDGADLEKGFIIDLNDHIIAEHRRYELKSIEPLIQGKGYLIIGQDVEAAPEEEQHFVKVVQSLTVNQGLS